MSDHFLTEITINEFKCFHDFTAKGFKRVNLIGGMNNIGKTALMEACYINARSIDILSLVNSIIHIKIEREFSNIATKGRALNEADLLGFLEYCKRYNVKSNLINQAFKIFSDGIKKQYHFCVGGESKTIDSSGLNMLDFLINNKNENIAYFAQLKQDSMLSKLFQVVQRKNKESELNNFIKEFDKDIENFKVIGNKPQCEISHEYHDITEFGDGLKSYILIVCALHACENGYLFIDEIENGIYYEHLDRLWEIILTISKETNCQVFATTHSKEMLESFARVAKKMDEQDVSFTTLFRNKSNEIKAITRDYEMILSSIEDEREVR